MKTHTDKGYGILKGSAHEIVSAGATIAKEHHEKWDGSGYPAGISGEEIPLSARIVALADVYDALSSKRPYKEPFSHEKSKAIILEGKGSHFDPNVIEAFLKCEDDFLKIREEFKGSGKLSPIQTLVNSISSSRDS